MEKRVLYGLVVMLMYLVDSGFSQGEVEWMSEEEAKWEQLLSKSQLPILVTVTSTLCGVRCALLEAQVSQLAKNYGNRIIFYKADILEKPFFANLYKVVNIPALIVFKDGKEMKRLENNFYWGAVYDLIYHSRIFYYAPAPTLSDSAPPPFDSAPTPSFLIQALGELTNWEETLVETEVPIVLAITSSLCGDPCVILMDQVTRLAETFGKKVIFYTANILEKPFLARLYKVLNVPTIIVFKGGKEISRYENLFDWSNIYELVFESSILGLQAPHPFNSASPISPQSWE